MNEKKIKLEGKCHYCDKTVSRQGLTKHLSTHLQKMENDNPSLHTALHITVLAGPYFLHLLVNASSTLKSLDSYLRNIWLECCGHLSQFSTERWGGKVAMTKKTGEIFSNIGSLIYQYDFGTTTELEIKVKDAYKIPVVGIILLSRNEPLPIMCSACNKKPATNICGVHLCEEDQGYYCDKCSVLHEAECEDFADYARLPLVNSPRTGECAYEGGTIDIERDGVYK